MREILLAEARFYSGTDTDLANLLIIENDEEFAFSLMRAFDLRQEEFVINILPNVKGLLQFLSARPRQDWLLVPDIIAIDLNHLGLEGFEFLARLENHPKFCEIPVIAFTKFCEDRCRLVSKGHENSLCMTKPTEAKRYVDVICDSLPNREPTRLTS